MRKVRFFFLNKRRINWHNLCSVQIDLILCVNELSQLHSFDVKLELGNFCFVPFEGSDFLVDDFENFIDLFESDERVSAEFHEFFEKSELLLLYGFSQFLL